MRLTALTSFMAHGLRLVSPVRLFPRPFACAGLLALAAAPAAFAAHYEAESAALVNFAPASVVADGAAVPPSPAPLNAVSGGYVFFDTGDTITFTITVPEAGSYNLAIRNYVPADFGNKYTQVYLDGNYLGETLLAASSSGSPGWQDAPIGSQSLTAGTHTVQLAKDWGWYYVDYLQVEPAIAEPEVGTHFEAETGVVTDGAALATGQGSSGTGFVTNFTSTGTLTLRVNLALPGPYRVRLGYRSPYGEKKTRVLVNGTELGEWTLPASSAWAQAGPFSVSLPAGVSEFTFQADWGYYDLDYLDFEYVEPAVALAYEAESGSLFRASVATARAGYTGTGYVTNFVQSPDATLTIPINLATGGPYRLFVRAATPFGPKMAGLWVDGVNQGEVSLNTTTEAFTEFAGPVVFLRQGLGMVTFVADWGYYDIDSIRLEKQVITPIRPKLTLVTPAESPESELLYLYLVTQFGRHTLAGQTEEPSITPDNPFVRIAQLTGKQPAIRDQDMIFHSSHGGWDDGTTPRGIAWHRNQKGIIAMQWHWFAPLGPTAFYTDQATFDITKAVTPGTPEYVAALADIDLIAAQLGQYAARRVPILWRPLHEAEGGWFWWGAKGPGPAKALYRMMFDRLVRYHGLNNLIWVWNSKDPAWYPGDDVVDIVSTDLYNSRFDYSPAPGTFLGLGDLGGHHKLVALAENGPIPDPDAMAEFKTMWSWFNTWNGDYIMNGLFNEESHVISVYHHEKVITLDELPDLRLPSGALLHGGKNYAGAVVDLPFGDYTGQALITRGLAGGLVGSLKIPNHLKVTLYAGENFTGKSKTYDKDTPDLSKASFTGPVKSVRIRFDF